MRSIWIGFLMLSLVWPAVARSDEREDRTPSTTTPSIAQLRAEFQRRVLAEVPAAGEDSRWLSEEIREINRIVARIAREVYGDHPTVLRATAEELLDELPTIQSGAWTGYVERHRVEDIAIINDVANLPEGAHAFEATLLASGGWQPKRAASLLKQIVFARALSPEQIGKRMYLAHYVPDRVYRVADRETTTFAVKSLHDFIIVEVRLSETGVFLPVSATWMTPKPRSDGEAGDGG